MYFVSLGYIIDEEEYFLIFIIRKSKNWFIDTKNCIFRLFTVYIKKYIYLKKILIILTTK